MESSGHQGLASRALFGPAFDGGAFDFEEAVSHFAEVDHFFFLVELANDPGLGLCFSQQTDADSGLQIHPRLLKRRALSDPYCRHSPE